MSKEMYLEELCLDGPRYLSSFQISPDQIKEVAAVQQAARALTVANLLIGITGFLKPFIQGGNRSVISFRPGYYLGVFAMNGPHALLHLGTGLAGLFAWNRTKVARWYMRLLVSVYGPLAAAGFATSRGSKRIHKLMGMALNPPTSTIHTLWTGIGLRFMQPTKERMRGRKSV